jgi:hypothetical protein
MLLRPSRFFTWLAELVSDVEDWIAGEGQWHDIRDRRLLPPTSEWDRPDTSHAPFHMPPDVERP